MKVEFEYSEEEVKDIVLKHHNLYWNPVHYVGTWVAETNYRGVIIRLKEPKKEATDES